MYDLATASSGYDKYIELDSGVTYTGGLLIGQVYCVYPFEFQGKDGVDVRIKGNGAIIDLQGEEICISYCDNRLDIDDCVIINGNIRYRGDDINGKRYSPKGFAKHITFYKPHDYGIRVQGAGKDITLERNIVVDAVNTGLDFKINGKFSNYLPTGTSFVQSQFAGVFGTPSIIDNWSFHTDPLTNQDLIWHFSMLCEPG